MLRVEIPKDKKKLMQQIKALEYVSKNDTNKKDIEIHRKALKELQEQLLYLKYLELQSKEFKEDVIGYVHLEQEGHEIIIKVNFTWGWLRVYRTKNNQIEWY